MVLNWTDASDYEAGFKIYWGPDCNSLQYLNSVGPDVTTYFDAWDQPSCYMVCAYNHEGEYCSNKDSASPTLIPAVPSNLNADKACQGIKLTWTDNSTNESGFRIERSSLKGWSEIGEVGPGVTTFTASYICSNPPCTCSNQTFRVYAFNACGNSAVSNSATQSSCGLFTQPPAAPSNLTAENVCRGRKFTWTDNSSNESGFIIEKSSLFKSFKIGEVGPGITTFTQILLCDNPPCAEFKNQFYRVVAYNPCGNSEPATLDTSLSFPHSAPPQAPTGLTTTAASSSQINLTWTDNATNEDGFKIERAPDSGGNAGTFAQIATVGANVTTYQNTDLLPIPGTGTG